MYSKLLYLVSFLLTLALSVPVKRFEPQDLPRLVIYFQTTHDGAGNPISMLPLITEKGIALTHLIVCSFHINLNSDVHLNDAPPSDPSFYTLWNETAVMKAAGVKVMGMVGGAAPGSFDSSTLDGDDNTFEHYYGQLRDIISQFGLQGMDLDVEQSMSQPGISRLISRLASDFGSDFIITLAPVASDLAQGSGLSGFNYTMLENSNGGEISFYNTQFYSGFGTMATPNDFERAVSRGWDPKRIVAGQLTSPANGGGFTSTSQLNATVIALREQYGQIGGVMGWEYFNSLPGSTSAPWEWAQAMTEILRPNDVPNLTITWLEAKLLVAAYEASRKVRKNQAQFAAQAPPTVDYMAMVNA